MALALPFVTEIWQVCVLIFLLQSASAAFTPTFQATIPDMLPDEARHTRALSLSRLAYDLESIVSPMLAAVLLAHMSCTVLFAGTVVGFVASAALVVSLLLPGPGPSAPRGVHDRSTGGIRLDVATLGMADSALAWTMFAFGAGSLTAALVLPPRLLDRLPDRPVMFGGAVVMVTAVLAPELRVLASGLDWPSLLTAWLLVGLGYSAVQTPSDRLLRRSAHAADRPALFAAQCALSHACWLLTYPLSGWMLTAWEAVSALLGRATLAALGILAAERRWPAADPVALEHSHDNLPRDHPHPKGNRRHSRALNIDDSHPRWARHFCG